MVWPSDSLTAGREDRGDHVFAGFGVRGLHNKPVGGTASLGGTMGTSQVQVDTHTPTPTRAPARAHAHTHTHTHACSSGCHILHNKGPLMHPRTPLLLCHAAMSYFVSALSPNMDTANAAVPT